MAEIRKKPFDMDIFSTLLPSLMSFHVKIYSKLRAMGYGQWKKWRASKFPTFKWLRNFWIGYESIHQVCTDLAVARFHFWRIPVVKGKDLAFASPAALGIPKSPPSGSISSDPEGSWRIGKLHRPEETKHHWLPCHNATKVSTKLLDSRLYMALWGHWNKPQLETLGCFVQTKILNVMIRIKEELFWNVSSWRLAVKWLQPQ